MSTPKPPAPAKAKLPRGRVMYLSPQGTVYANPASLISNVVGAFIPCRTLAEARAVVRLHGMTPELRFKVAARTLDRKFHAGYSLRSCAAEILRAIGVVPKT